MNENLKQHIDMLVSSLKSPVLNDQDITELFGLLLEQVGNHQAGLVMSAMIAFSDEKPALYADIVRRRLASSRESTVALLLRQLDDPEVPDETIDRSIRLAIEETRKNQTSTDLALVLPLVFDLRRDAMCETTLEMHLEELEKSLDKLEKWLKNPGS